MKRRDRKTSGADPATANGSARPGGAWLGALLAAGIVAAVHRPVVDCRSIFFDDPAYLFLHDLVQNPSWDSAARLVLEVRRPTMGGYYQPLTMISLMLDTAAGGHPDNLRPYRRTSLVLHSINTLLVVLLLSRLLGSPGWATAAGVLFGLHPLTVEPVAWIAERGTLLAAMFCLAACLAWADYARAGGPARWSAAAVLYVLAMLCKPTAVALPMALAVLDLWPLGRRGRWVVLDKLPLLAAGALFTAITFVSRCAIGRPALPTEWPIGRIPLTICLNVAFYPFKVLWPVTLATRYPYPEPMSLSNPEVIAHVLGATAILAGLVFSLRRAPAIAAGGAFFLAALLPTVQFVGFNDVAAADKYAYVPAVGLLLATAWGLGRIDAAGGRKPLLAGVLLAAVVLAGLTRRQLGFWKDTETLYRHTMAVAPRDARLVYNFACFLSDERRYGEALEYYRLADRLKPGDLQTLLEAGYTALRGGLFEEALAFWKRAEPLAPGHLELQHGIGLALDRLGRQDEAVPHYLRALQGGARALDARFNLARILANRGELQDAAGQYRAILDRRPNDLEARLQLARLLVRLKQPDEAVRQYRRILQQAPGLPEAASELAALQASRPG